MKFRLLQFVLATSVLLGSLALFMITDVADAGATTFGGGGSCAANLGGTEDGVAADFSYQFECTGLDTTTGGTLQDNFAIVGNTGSYSYLFHLAFSGLSFWPASFSCGVLAGNAGCTVSVGSGSASVAVSQFAIASNMTCHNYLGYGGNYFPCSASYAGTPPNDYVAIYVGGFPLPKCDLTSFSGDSFTPVSDGTTSYPFSLGWAYSVNRIVAVDQIGISAGSYAGDPTITYDGMTFPKAAIEANSGPLAYGVSVDPTVLGITWNSGDNIQPEFWCDGGGSAWTDWGSAATLGGISTLVPGGTSEQNGTAPCLYGGSYVNTELTCNPPPGQITPSGGTDGGPFNLTNCFTTQGMSLYNPISWVTGAVKFGACAAEWLFEPSSTNVAALSNEFGVTSNAPTGSDPASQWLGTMAKGVVAFPYASVSSIQSVADGGGCSGSPLTDSDTLHGQNISACTILTSLSTLPTSAGTAINWIQLILTAIIYVFGGLLLFHFVRKMVEQ